MQFGTYDMLTSEIRREFINFFEKEGYRLLPRASLLDESIPMSFVMSAGLVQVERSLARDSNRNGERFMLVQDCFRHFDLDKVGKDDVHLSMFEMPGVFMFGPIDKADTIRRMWQLATSVLGINKDRLWASYFKGGIVMDNDVPGDEIARQAWLEMGLPEERIAGLGPRDNFWLQGKGFNGGDIIRKSGPNTELFYDLGVQRSCSPVCGPGCRCGRFLEFSNSLFICYEIAPDCERLKRLRDPFSETVIGIERVAMILQEKESVFEIDSYQSVLNVIRQYINVDDVNRPWVQESERVLADYLKALYMLVADAAPPPGKNGRERIVKQLIRGVLTRQLLLGIVCDEFIPDVLACLAQGIDESRKDPRINEQVLDYFSTQRDKFLSTVERGYLALEKSLQENNGQTLSGQQILHLEKNIGIPRLLVERELRRKRLSYNRAAYEDALAHWKRYIPV
jgi:alanyl-tRNA synthetase